MTQDSAALEVAETHRAQQRREIAAHARTAASPAGPGRR